MNKVRPALFNNEVLAQMVFALTLNVFASITQSRIDPARSSSKYARSSTISTMANFSAIEKWQDAFAEYSVPEISQLNAKLRDHVTSKKLELRDLVGNRYRDMLKTSDIILTMNETIGKEDDALSDLCTTDKYLSWSTNAANVAKFSDPKQSVTLRTQSTETLLYAVVGFLKKHLRTFKASIDNDSKYHQDHVLIARGLWLAKLLLNDLGHSINKRKYGLAKLEVNALEKKFVETIEHFLLHGEGSDNVSLQSYNSMFLAYSILHKCTATEVLKRTLLSRIEHIRSQLENVETPEDVFPHVLKLISSTFKIVRQAFSKNSVIRVISQQSEIYSLLDCPEFSDKAELNVGRYKRWLSEAVISRRAFPSACVEEVSDRGRASAKASAALDKLLKTFQRDIVELLTEKLPSIFASIYNLHTSVELYRKVLTLVQDTPSLRNLSSSGDNDNDDQTFHRTFFFPKWTKRFNEIIEIEVNKLLATEKTLSSLHGAILANTIQKSNALSTSDYIFSSEFLGDVTDAKGADYATILIDALSDFANGSIGDIKEISHEYKTWLASVSSVQEHIEQVSQIKGHIKVRYKVSSTSKDLEIDFDDDEEDEESAEFWRRTEKKIISESHALFNSHASSSLTRVHGEMLERAQNLLDVNGTNTRGVVLLLRAVLLLETHIRSLAPMKEEKSRSFVENAYAILATCITESMVEPFTAEVYEVNQTDRLLWFDVSLPSSPSLFILDYLSKLLRRLTAEVGHDEMLWQNTKGLQSIREKVGGAIFTYLQDVATAISDSKEKTEIKPVESAPSANETSVGGQDSESTKEAVPVEEGEGEGETGIETEEQPEENEVDSTVTETPSAAESALANDEQASASLLQIEMDSRFISKLIGISRPASLVSHTALSETDAERMDTMVQDVVKRMHILYLPLAL